ncbi:Retrotransposon Polyprotein [Phytophthora megakarya]|uniref:Retrotransposon Polyprotein n=1 Tax=Phytophthora megakarya TaxID=4795 RepID=A0A225W6N6_9STRA|nr:Retrotransposon Polyprotein [Phytophthora megakarya]
MPFFKILIYDLYERTFTIVTDHSALRWLMTTAKLAGRLHRWSLTLQEYEFKVEYRPGATNVVADDLSRAPAAVLTAAGRRRWPMPRAATTVTQVATDEATALDLTWRERRQAHHRHLPLLNWSPRRTAAAWRTTVTRQERSNTRHTATTAYKTEEDSEVHGDGELHNVAHVNSVSPVDGGTAAPGGHVPIDDGGTTEGACVKIDGSVDVAGQMSRVSLLPATVNDEVLANGTADTAANDDVTTVVRANGTATETAITVDEQTAIETAHATDEEASDAAHSDDVHKINDTTEAANVVATANDTASVMATVGKKHTTNDATKEATTANGTATVEDAGTASVHVEGKAASVTTLTSVMSSTNGTVDINDVVAANGAANAHEVTMASSRVRNDDGVVANSTAGTTAPGRVPAIGVLTATDAANVDGSVTACDGSKGMMATVSPATELMRNNVSKTNKTPTRIQRVAVTAPTVRLAHDFVAGKGNKYGGQKMHPQRAVQERCLLHARRQQVQRVHRE